MTLETQADTDIATRERADARRTGDQRLAIIDSDVHPTVASMSEMRPYLSERWWRYFQTYGARPKHGFGQGDPYPKAAPRAARRDAWPEKGPPGSDLAFMRRHYLDAYDVEYGILSPLNADRPGRPQPRVQLSRSAGRSTTGSATSGPGRRAGSRPRSSCPTRTRLPRSPRSIAAPMTAISPRS